MRLLLASFAILVMCSGCCQSAGTGVGKGVTGFTSGVGKGVDEELLVNVRFSDEATRQGLASNTAKWAGKKVQLYLTSKGAFEGRLIAKGMNKEGKEIGRSILPVSLAADGAQYVAFAFPPEMDTQLVHEYWVDILK
jgi:hypothetical protein